VIYVHEEILESRRKRKRKGNSRKKKGNREKEKEKRSNLFVAEATVEYEAMEGSSNFTLVPNSPYSLSYVSPGGL
jgi:hypothetical protein